MEKLPSKSIDPFSGDTATRNGADPTNDSQFNPGYWEKIYGAQEEAKSRLDRKKRAALRSLEIISGDDILKMPPKSWLIRTKKVGVMTTTGIFMVSAAMQNFKTTVALDLGLSISNGLDTWLGMDLTVHIGDDGEPPHVVFAIGEGGDGIRDRIEAWLVAHPGTDLKRFHLIPFAGISLDDVLDVNDVLELIRSRTGTAPVAMTVFDALGDAISSNENKSNEASPVVNSLKRISRELGGLCGVIHHTGHDESRMRGSKRWEDVMDTVLHIENQVMSAKKIKEDDKAKFEPIILLNEKVAASFIVRPAGSHSVGDAQQIHARGQQTDEAKKIRIMGYLRSSGKEVTPTAMKLVLGSKQDVAKRLLQELADDGQIRARQVGSRSYYKIKVT